MQIHGISYQVALEFSSSSWNLLLQYFGDVIRILLGKLNTPGNYALIRPVLESLEFVRFASLFSSVSLRRYYSFLLLSLLHTGLVFCHLDLECCLLSCVNLLNLMRSV